MTDDAEKCFELAMYFVADADEAEELSEAIHDAIDMWISKRDNANEAAWERQQEALMESGGPDDSQFRRDMQNSGRSHLLKD